MRHTTGKHIADQTPAIVRRMGRAMADISAGFGACTDADLLTQFSASDIARHGDAARSFARELTKEKLAA